MFGNLKVIKSYYKLSNVKIWLVVLEFVFLLVPSGASIYSAVLTANVISSITVYDFSSAIYYLTFDFALIIVSAISYFAYHLLSKKVNRQISKNLNEYVYSNVLKNENISKISLSTINNISKCVDFNKDLLYKLCFFLKSVVILGIVFYYSTIIGLGLIAVSIIMGILLQITDKKIQVSQKQYSRFESNSLELFNSIQKGSKIEETSNLEMRLKDKYFKEVDEGARLKNKIAFYYSINNNFISLLLKSAVFGFSVYLILLVKSTTLTLSVFLILIPYLSSSAQNLIAFFELFSEIGLIDNILREFDALQFQSQISEVKPQPNIENYCLYFYHATLDCTKNGDGESSIFDMNLKIEFGKTIAFVGESGSGKNAIFKLITKEENCTSGSIFIDYKNISEIFSDSYSKIVASAKYNSYFFNLSIMENFLLVCDSKQKINKTLKDFDLIKLISKLPSSTNSIVEENFDSKLIYFLSIARAYLSGAKIICIYDYPSTFSKAECDRLLKILKFLKNKVTTIFFSRTDIAGSIADKTFYVENSKIKNNEKT